MAGGTGLIPFSGTVWRMIFAGQDACAPVRSPEGRFHHSGQTAIYTSLTAEGTAVAIRRYVAPGEPPRVVAALDLAPIRVADHRGNPALSVVWQDIRAAGDRAPTWAWSDAARAKGAQGLLYSSRSRPDLTHLVLFAVTDGMIRSVGPQLEAAPWLRPA